MVIRRHLQHQSRGRLRPGLGIKIAQQDAAEALAAQIGVDAEGEDFRLAGDDERELEAERAPAPDLH